MDGRDLCCNLSYLVWIYFFFFLPALWGLNPGSPVVGKQIRTELQPVPSCSKLRQRTVNSKSAWSLVRPVSMQLSGRDPGLQSLALEVTGQGDVLIFLISNYHPPGHSHWKLPYLHSSLQIPILGPTLPLLPTQCHTL